MQGVPFSPFLGATKGPAIKLAGKEEAHMSYIDRERRRTKLAKRTKWATALLRPLTFKTLVMVGVWTTRVVWVVYRLSKVFRE
jgi:hypothetical protein